MSLMNAYLLLICAIATEVIATSALKGSYGFSKLYPSLIACVGYTVSFWCLSLTLKTLPVSIVYAIWSGLGIVGIAFIGVLLFRESFGIWHYLGTGLVLAGVFILTLITEVR